MDAGVMSCGRLDLEVRTRGAGEAFRSIAGDFGGTWGGNSRSCTKVAVLTFSAGFGLALGLRMGDNGLVDVGIISEVRGGVFCCA